MSKELEWEQIDNYHKRAKIRGGWLVKAYEDVYHLGDDRGGFNHDLRVSMCFVPDAMHAWTL